MQCTFKVEGFIVRFREVKSGLVILVGEKPFNQLGKPKFYWLAIWEAKAKAIKAKLRPGQVFSFEGSITENRKNDKSYMNYTVEKWMVVPKPERPAYKPVDRDDDWFVPEIENRDTRSQRLAEGFEDPF